MQETIERLTLSTRLRLLQAQRTISRLVLVWNIIRLLRRGRVDQMATRLKWFTRASFGECNSEASTQLVEPHDLVWALTPNSTRTPTEPTRVHITKALLASSTSLSLGWPLNNRIRYNPRSVNWLCATFVASNVNIYSCGHPT